MKHTVPIRGAAENAGQGGGEVRGAGGTRAVKVPKPPSSRKGVVN